MSALSPRARLASVTYAVAGLATLLKTQPNARIHLAATIAALALGLGLQLAAWEWVAVIFAIAIVWLAEAMNTALEFLCDAVTKDIHPLIKSAKDVAAGGVLVAAVSAALGGILVFLPHLWPLLGL